MDETRQKVRARVVSGGQVVIGPSEFAAMADARAIVAKAREQAARIMGKAQEEVDRIRADAQHMGREEGLAQVTELLLAARVQGEALRRQAVSSLVSLAIRVAEKVLATEIQMRPELVKARVLGALEQVAWCRRIVIRVSPEDLELLERHKGDLLARLPEASVDLIADPEITRGGCRIDSEAGQIDATLESQLAAIERTLMETVNE